MRRHRIHLGDDVREVDFKIGDPVYLKCRDEPVRGLVTGYYVMPSDLLYIVAWGNTGNEQRHYGIELSGEFTPHFDGGPAGGAATAGGEG